MTDQKLIEQMAALWVDNGGDAEGIDWCHRKIKQAVADELQRREGEAKQNEYEKSLLRG